MPSAAPAKSVRGSSGCTVRPKTRLSLHRPFMTRRQLSPPSLLSHSPLPIVPAQIVYFPDMAFLPRNSVVPAKAGTHRSAVAPLENGIPVFAETAARFLVRAFPPGMRDVDDDAVGPRPFHLEIRVAAGRHPRI